MEFGMVVLLYMWFMLAVMVCKTMEVTGEGVVMNAVFFGSFHCHYVWLFHYLWRGRELRGSLHRWPNLLEAVTLVLNVSSTVLSFFEVVRRVFGLRFQFLAPWVAVSYLVYGGAVFAFHKAWRDTLMLDLPSQQCADPQQETLIKTQV